MFFNNSSNRNIISVPPPPAAIFSISFFYGTCFSIFYNDQFEKCKVVLLVAITMIGLISSNHYLYTTEMSQKKDNLVVYDAYSLIKNNIEDKEIAFVNKNALDIADWAVNRILFFLTNSHLHLSPPTPQQTELCEKDPSTTTSIINIDKPVLCLR